MSHATASSLVDALRDRYVLERELGRGGMATVYLAQDVKHDRPVVLKVLLPEFASESGPEVTGTPQSFSGQATRFVPPEADALDGRDEVEHPRADRRRQPHRPRVLRGSCPCQRLSSSRGGSPIVPS